MEVAGVIPHVDEPTAGMVASVMKEKGRKRHERKRLQTS